MHQPNKTLVGVLSTAGAWHRWAPGYSLHHLEMLVRGFAPDLLCAEINQDDWEATRITMLPPEYQERLIPLCRALNVIVVPIGNEWSGLPSPLRLALPLGIGPRWVNSIAADRWHRAWAQLWPCSDQANRELVRNILGTIHRDPGRRVLVTVRMERRYVVVDGLRQADEVALFSVGPWKEKWRREMKTVVQVYVKSFSIPKDIESPHYAQQHTYCAPGATEMTLG